MEWPFSTPKSFSPSPAFPKPVHRRIKSILLPLRSGGKSPISSLPKRRQQYTIRRESPDMDLMAKSNAIVTALTATNKEKRNRLESVLVHKKSEADALAKTEDRRKQSVLRSTSEASSPVSQSPTEVLFPLFLPSPTPTPSLSVPLPALPASFHHKANRKERARRAFSAVRHFLQLCLPSFLIPKLRLLVPQKPLSARQSGPFLMACRMGEVEIVGKMLCENRWLALEYDKVKKTGLHWAARRNHIGVIELLVKAGAFVDARDCIGRTPLFFAAKAGHLGAVSLLLGRKADPFLRTFGNISPADASSHSTIRRLLMRSMQLSILLRFVDKSKRKCVWEKEIIDFFHADLRMSQRNPA